jgi:hypothetical protein
MAPLETFFLTCDVLLTGFTVGTTVWFFFVQSPFLFNLMGREKFVPNMMQMTRLWVSTMFLSVSALVTVCLAAPYVLGSSATTASSITLNGCLLGLSWLAIAVNKFIIVPKALKVGAKSHNERKGDNSKDVKSFVVQGGSKTQTKTLHQTVVVFVLLMTVALVAHTVVLIDSISTYIDNCTSRSGLAYIFSIYEIESAYSDVMMQPAAGAHVRPPRRPWSDANAWNSWTWSTAGA